jgi:hypothetical protein
VSTILQSSGSVRGQYSLPVLQVCAATKTSPVDIDNELQRLAKAKLIEFSYSGEADFFYVRREFDDESYEEFTSELFERIAKEEADLDRDFDIAFSLCQNPDELANVVETGQPNQMTPIPHVGANPDEIRKLLVVHKRAKLTPRAIARIFHGIGSPGFEIAEWARTPFWGAQAMASFADIMRVARSLMLTAGRPES